MGNGIVKLGVASEDEMFEEKRNVVFDHLLSSFFDDGGSVYASSGSQRSRLIIEHTFATVTVWPYSAPGLR